MVNTIYLSAIVITLLMNLTFFVANWTRKQTTTSILYNILALTIVIIELFYLLFFLSKQESSAFFWVRMRFLPLSFSSVITFLFILSYLGYSQFLKLRIVLILLIIPIITNGVIWLAPDYFWADWTFMTGDLISIEEKTFTGWFTIHALYSYALSISNLGLLLSATLFETSKEKRHVQIVFAGMFAGIVLSTLNSVGIGADLPSLIPIGFAVMTLFFFWAIVKDDFLKLPSLTYEQIILKMPDAVFIFDLEHRLRLLNLTARDLLDSSYQEVLGKTAQELYAIANLSPIYQASERDMKANIRFETEITGKGEARNYDVLISPIPNKSGRIDHHMVIMRDITRRVAVELELLNSEKKYRYLAENSSDSIVLMSANSEGISYANSAMTVLTGYSMDEILNFSIPELQDFVHPDDLSRVLQERQIQKETIGPSLKQIYRIRPRNAEQYIWVENHRTLILDNEGEILQVLITFRDITDRVEEQERKLNFILEKERTRILSDFIQNSAHEFRTPLSIIATSNYIMNKSEDEATRAEKSDLITKQIQGITQLTDKMLLLAKLESEETLEFKTVNLDRLIKNLIVEMTSKYENLQIPINQNLSSLSAITGDEKYLTIALREILDNAHRHNHENTTISITSGVEMTQIWIEISDTGDGISEDDLPYIFKTFWRKDEAHTMDGFGLGLPIAKRIIQSHKGDIAVMSDVREGSQFRITIPTNTSSGSTS